MKAAQRNSYGPPKTLRVQEIDKPVPESNEILIRVHATTVNRTDCAILRGEPLIVRLFTGLRTPTNPITGTDFAGVVEAVGKDVTSFNKGDRVFGFDDLGLGSHAQYISLPEDQAMATFPESFSFEQAAASIEGFHYAYNAINKVDIQPGQKVLVNGATGAIGSAAVQLLKNMGAQVIAVGNTENIQLVESLGAERVIDYRQEDFTRINETFRLVYDAVGKSSFGQCKPLLEPGGVYISSELGRMAENVFFALSTPLTAKLPGFGLKPTVVFPFPSDIPRSLRLINELAEKDAFAPVIDRTYSLNQISEAFRYVETGEKTGNVVIPMD